MSDRDFHTVSDLNHVPDRDAGEAVLPGYPVEGHPGWRAGAFGSGRGLLGLIKVSDPSAENGEASMPAAYMPDGHGGVQLRPGFAATHPKGPFDFAGMAKEIHWPGVALDLAKITAGVALGVAPSFLAPATAGAAPNPWFAGGSLAWKGGRTLYKQNEANRRNVDPVVRPGVDKASNGLP